MVEKLVILRPSLQVVSLTSSTIVNIFYRMIWELFWEMLWICIGSVNFSIVFDHVPSK